MPVAMAMAYLFGLELLDLCLRRHRGMNIILRWQPSIRHKRMERQRRGSRARSQRGGSGRKSNSDF